MQGSSGRQHSYSNIERRHNFYKRVSNMTNIEFDNCELKILGKGLKSNNITI